MSTDPKTTTSAEPLTGRRPLLAVAVALALAVGAAAGVLGLRSLEWPVDVVHIEGETRHIDRAALQRIVSHHVRDGFFGTDLSALRRDLVAMPWVRDASLRRVWPDRLDVDVREHTAAAVWNEDALVSTRGVVFRPDAFRRDGLPVLRGPVGQAETMLERYLAFRPRLADLDLELVVIEQDARRSWALELDDGLVLILGREQIDARLDRFIAVWPIAIAGKRETIRRVDLRYPNGFAIAWRDDAGKPAEGGA